ncbi:monofunctional biosynthetic peptidoglycan transglycosylase [Dethiosulfatarculus sandiegensis]|uniref:Biosynthetic peptidoglycan transglycosylase n=1 Tax=Dethiosulfatarculus sandiegensis TaxID=1429043 RepID=A0A0D2GA13_9BACT|nr:monofunctional biosynthetic peptidoglycan transglycosylase [Dethiosulfatarculus sandiegensis]KIX11707.1 peptidoglycan transglycosylase [Dethiosulfatarculus sandiegensis]
MSFKRLKLFLLLLVLFLTADVCAYFFIPDVSALKTVTPKISAFMQQRLDEAELKGRPLSIKRKYVPLSRISPYLRKAVLIAEDDKFWHHEGFDFDAIERAFERNLEEKRFAFGASTITQQLARNLYLTPSKNPLRKAKEAILTFRMENQLSKKRILELYLNFAEWGKGIFGAEAAARYYFKKSASRLRPMEAARLAAILPNPRYYNPAGKSRYVRIKARRIYRIMQRRGF